MPPIKFLDLSILSSFRPNVNPSTSKELKETYIRAYDIASIWYRSHAYITSGSSFPRHIVYFELNRSHGRHTEMMLATST